MKAYFNRLFQFDAYANQIILDAIIKAGEPEKAAQLMAHILAAQQIWLNRCLGLPQAAVELWIGPGAKATGFAEKIQENHSAWIICLNGFTDTDFDNTIYYQNLRGDKWESKLVDILAHVINHGTHHRAQIGQQLKFNGAETLPNTDYIAYIRQINS
ncbi:DinB family protein [Mucilaginibacter flavidus]|uniref:DinB family protein n=1 Tax=Mucilaginibacter flavidus TaxID=2949309 RepID=UPI0020929C63|nr:DinB family protein [Mucilaginibacter flavidus]MCO5950285.1 DinB family protein [Mucilaginibacter flavidus]